MKKLTSLVLALALGLSLAACGGSADTTAPADDGADTAAADAADTGDAAPAENAAPADDAAADADAGFTTVEEGVLTMSTNAKFPPYESVADGEGIVGGFEGIDIEVANEIAKKLGLELQVDDMEFSAALEAAQSGKTDMVMAGVTVNADRKAVMDFSDTYATGIQVVIVTEDSDITSVDDLEGKMIGCQEGTTGYIYCSDTPENGGYGEDHVTAYNNGMSAVQALQNGQVDCVVIDNAPAQEFVKANPGLKILDTEFTVEDYAIGVKKGNTALLDAINAALAELKADGELDAIIAKYIPAE